MKPRKVVQGGCGACARAREVLPRPIANGLASLEERALARRRAAAASVASEVPPNQADRCSHGTPRGKPCALCVAALEGMRARDRDPRE